MIDLTPLTLPELVTLKKQLETAIITAAAKTQTKTIKTFQNDGWTNKIHKSANQITIEFNKSFFSASIIIPYASSPRSIELRAAGVPYYRDSDPATIIRMAENYNTIADKWIPWLQAQGYTNITKQGIEIRFTIDHPYIVIIRKDLDGWLIVIQKPASGANPYTENHAQWVISDYYAPNLIPNPPTIKGITAVGQDNKLNPDLLSDPETIPWFLGEVHIKNHKINFITNQDATTIYPVGNSYRSISPNTQTAFMQFPIKITTDYHTRTMKESIQNLIKQYQVT